jgi:RNA polymerase sigma factor FliA
VKTQTAAQTDEKLAISMVWDQFHKGHEDCYRNMLMEHYRDLVRYAAERLHSKLPDKVELDDLISAGIFGLMDASTPTIRNGV